MKWVFIIFLSVTVFFILGYFFTGYLDNRYFKRNVLSESTESIEVAFPTTTIIPSPTQTASPTPTPSPKPTDIPTQTPIPQPKITSEAIHLLLERFAGQYGVDVNVLRHIAVCESGFDPSATNGKYAGLYQFDKNTWINNRKIIGEDPNPNLRLNAEEAIQTAAYLVSLGKFHLWPNCKP